MGYFYQQGIGRDGREMRSLQGGAKAEKLHHLLWKRLLPVNWTRHELYLLQDH
jgi:hypothetical protein